MFPKMVTPHNVFFLLYLQHIQQEERHVILPPSAMKNDLETTTTEGTHSPQPSDGVCKKRTYTKL